MNLHTIMDLTGNPECSYVKLTSQRRFLLIPGMPLAFWVSEALVNAFSYSNIGDYMITREGMATANNDLFMRYWHEVSTRNFSEKNDNYLETSQSKIKWFPYNKGGLFRKWYGNNEFVVNWLNDGNDIKNNIDEKTGRVRSHNYNGAFAFREGLTWSAISSSDISVRYCKKGFLFDSKGAKGFPKHAKHSFFILSLLNSIVANSFLQFISPTLDYKVGDIIIIPAHASLSDNIIVSDLTKRSISISEVDWDSFETSWDFKRHPML